MKIDQKYGNSFSRKLQLAIICLNKLILQKQYQIRNQQPKKPLVQESFLQFIIPVLVNPTGQKYYKKNCLLVAILKIRRHKKNFGPHSFEVQTITPPVSGVSSI